MRVGWLLLLLLCGLSVQASPPALMLASEYRDGIPVSEYRVSEKLDGVRGYWDGRALWTRGGHRIHAPAWFVAGWPQEPMDGELWMARGRFDDVSALVRGGGNDRDWRQVHFKVFDLPARPGPFDVRLKALRALLAGSGVDWLQPVAQRRVAVLRSRTHGHHVRGERH